MLTPSTLEMGEQVQMEAQCGRDALRKKAQGSGRPETGRATMVGKLEIPVRAEVGGLNC
jgi:hypothetical protein